MTYSLRIISLQDTMDAPNKYYYIIHSYLDKTFLCTYFWHAFFSSVVKSGAPQGSILGPLLLNILMISVILFIGKLAMTGWDWRLITAVSTCLLFIPGWFAMWTMVWWHWLKLTPSLSTRALWQLPVLSGGPAIGDISGASVGGRRKWGFSLSHPVGLQENFYMP
jgi:hypothetical protein